MVERVRNFNDVFRAAQYDYKSRRLHKQAGQTLTLYPERSQKRFLFHLLPIAVAEVACRACYLFYLPIFVKDRDKDVFIIAGDACRAHIRCLIAYRLTSLEDCLYLLVQSGGKCTGIAKVEEVFADGLVEFELPEVQERLVDVSKAAIVVKNVGKIHNGREYVIDKAFPLLKSCTGDRQVMRLRQ